MSVFTDIFTSPRRTGTYIDSATPASRASSATLGELILAPFNDRDVENAALAKMASTRDHATSNSRASGSRANTPLLGSPIAGGIQTIPVFWGHFLNPFNYIAALLNTPEALRIRYIGRKTGAESGFLQAANFFIAFFTQPISALGNLIGLIGNLWFIPHEVTKAMIVSTPIGGSASLLATTNAMLDKYLPGYSTLTFFGGFIGAGVAAAYTAVVKAIVNYQAKSAAADKVQALTASYKNAVKAAEDNKYETTFTILNQLAQDAPKLLVDGKPIQTIFQEYAREVEKQIVNALAKPAESISTATRSIEQRINDTKYLLTLANSTLYNEKITKLSNTYAGKFELKTPLQQFTFQIAMTAENRALFAERRAFDAAQQSTPKAAEFSAKAAEFRAEADRLATALGLPILENRSGFTTATEVMDARLAQKQRSASPGDLQVVDLHAVSTVANGAVQLHQQQQRDSVSDFKSAVVAGYTEFTTPPATATGTSSQPTVGARIPSLTKSSKDE